MKLNSAIAVAALSFASAISLAEEYKITNIFLNRGLSCDGYFLEIPPEVVFKNIGLDGLMCNIQLVYPKNISLSGKKVVIAEIENRTESTNRGEPIHMRKITNIRYLTIKE